MSSGAKDSDATGFQMEQVLVSHPEQLHIVLMFVGSSWGEGGPIYGKGRSGSLGMIHWTSIIYLPMTEHMEQKPISYTSHRKWRSRYNKRWAHSRELQAKLQLTSLTHTHTHTHTHTNTHTHTHTWVYSHNYLHVCLGLFDKPQAGCSRL